MSTATTDAPQSSPDTGMVRYMWVITVQWPARTGFGNATFASTTDIPADASRLDIYTQIVEMAERATHADRPNVLFFSLEPDRLNG